MMKMNYQNKKIYLLLVISLLLILGAWILFKWNANKVEIYNISGVKMVKAYRYPVPTRNNSRGTYIYNLERNVINYNAKNQTIEISGWLIKKDFSIKAGEQYVLLKNETTKRYYKLPTYIVARNDLNRNLKTKHDYEYAGFFSKTYLSKKIDPQKYNYKIFILYKSNGNNVLVSLDKTLSKKSEK